MAEILIINPKHSKDEKYEAIYPQIQALILPEPNLVANLANISAVLKEAFGFFWVGFYFVENEELVLGPFQGPVACSRFPISQGVCGAAVTQKKTIIVPDVDKFPGHISCSVFSRSEIVVPLLLGEKVVLVLDVDSEVIDDFDQSDQNGLERILTLVSGLNFQ